MSLAVSNSDDLSQETTILNTTQRNIKALIRSKKKLLTASKTIDRRKRLLKEAVVNLEAVMNECTRLEQEVGENRNKVYQLYKEKQAVNLAKIEEKISQNQDRLDREVY
jgi:SMC interacting uncharacterized protein involved in chromosome segregation